MRDIALVYRIRQVLHLLLLPILLLPVVIRADEVRILAIHGQPVPGGDGQSATLNRFTGFVNSSIPLISNSGHAMFVAELSGVSSTIRYGIWRADSSGGISLVARVGSGAWAPFSGLAFSALAGPMIAPGGEISFQGTLAGPGISASNAQSYWIYNGEPLMVVREGESAPGVGSGGILGPISNIAFGRGLSGNSFLQYYAQLIGGGVTAATNRAQWLDGPGANNATLLAQAGSSIPGISQLTCKDPMRVTNPSGDLLLYCSLIGPGIITTPTDGSAALINDQVIWAPGAPQYLARAGDIAPDTGGNRFGMLFSPTSTVRRPQVNIRGHTLFAPGISDSSGISIDSGLFSDRNGSLRAVAYTGLSANGLPAGVVISSPIAPVSTNSFAYVLAENDSVVFAVLLAGPGVNFSNNRAIIRSNPDGALQLLARGGQQIPGAPAGLIISNSSIARTWRVNANGEIAFLANLVSPDVTDLDDVGVFATYRGELRMIAREGADVPQSGGWRFSSMIPEPLIYFNARGQLLFPSGAYGGPTGVGGTSGWFRADENGEVRAIALGGEILPGQSGAQLRMSTMLPTSPLSFNDQGELVYFSSLGAGSMSGDSLVGGDAIVKVKIIPDEIVPQCLADFNSDGNATVQDLFDYLAAFFAQQLRADFNSDGGITVQDLFDFLTAWFEGC